VIKNASAAHVLPGPICPSTSASPDTTWFPANWQAG
jgi:hypothetical protein